MLRARQAFDFLISKAPDLVIIDEANRFHKSVTDGGTHKAKTQALQCSTEFAGAIGFGWQASRGGPSIMNDFIANKTPKEVGERSMVRLYREERFGVGHRGLDLQAIANDAGVREQSLTLAFVKPCDLWRGKILIDTLVLGALGENRVPAQPRLGAFESQHFEQIPVVAGRHAPFFIVIRDGEVIAFSPSTSFHCGHTHSGNL